MLRPAAAAKASAEGQNISLQSCADRDGKIMSGAAKDGTLLAWAAA